MAQFISRREPPGPAQWEFRGVTHAGNFIMRFGETQGGKYSDFLRDRPEYCLWILAPPAKCKESISDVQSYVRDKVVRYDFPIGTDTTNDGWRQEYNPMKTPGIGYDTYEE